MSEIPQKLEGSGPFPTNWNKLVDLVVGTMRIQAQAPLNVSRVPGGFALRLTDPGILVYELVDYLYVGQTNPTSTAKQCDWIESTKTWTAGSEAKEVEIYPGVIRGYHFEGDKIYVASLGGNLTCVENGATYARGTLSGSLASGGSISLTVRGSKTITAWGYFGTASSSANVGVTWDDYDHKWYAGDASC